MKTARVRAIDMASTLFKRAAVVLPQPEDGPYGASAVGMLFPDDTLFCLRAGDPDGERMARVARDRNILLAIRDPSTVCRTVGEDTLYQRARGDVPPTGTVAGAQADRFPRPFAARASNAPDFAITL